MMSIAWIFVTGSFQIAGLISGLIIGISLAYEFRRFFPGEMHVHLYTLSASLKFTGSFMKDLLISNITVACTVLSPSMPIKEGMLEYNTELRSPTAMTILANAITLTPGTLVVECRESDGKMLIHCLNSNKSDEIRKGIRKWECMLKKIFGEGRK
ncbi:MAG: multicomponent Na+:H+ antiporter subunit E [Candidatus Nanohaloarchaea archaeon]|jgi:multicomponent Na+:H+ antiporter subunit E